MKTDNLCLNCESPLQGRADKKFCDVYCRNSYNNEKLRERNNTMRNIEHALRRNRKILEKLYLSKRTKNRNDLLTEGFTFQFFTHQIEGKHCVYDFTYTIDKKDVVKVAKIDIE